MDSKNGGIASPILKDNNKFYPLPIPFSPSVIPYEDVNIVNSIKVSDFIRSVNPKYYENEKNLKNCHLDPDIRQSSLNKRHGNWKKAFGQVSHSQSHLNKEGVGIGDIFLFFGWFQFAELKNIDGKEQLRYIEKSQREFANGFHAIYGYFQIGKIIKTATDEIPDYLSEHPHVKHKNEKPFSNKNNTVYVAKEFLQINGQNSQEPGAGYFKFSDNLILTKSKETKRTEWQLPNFFYPDNGIELTHHKRESWSLFDDKTFLKSASIGQEFVFKNDSKSEVENWAIELIKSHLEID